MSIHTWKQQKAKERAIKAASRKAWLQDLADSCMSGVQCAKVAEIERTFLYKQMRDHNVKMKTYGRPPKPKPEVVEPTPEEIEAARKMQAMRDELNRRTAALVREGHPKAAAMMAAAYQMGLRVQNSNEAHQRG